MKDRVVHAEIADRTLKNWSYDLQPFQYIKAGFETPRMFSGKSLFSKSSEKTQSVSLKFKVSSFRRSTVSIVCFVSSSAVIQISINGKDLPSRTVAVTNTAIPRSIVLDFDVTDDVERAAELSLVLSLGFVDPSLARIALEGSGYGHETVLNQPWNWKYALNVCLFYGLLATNVLLSLVLFYAIVPISGKSYGPYAAAVGAVCGLSLLPRMNPARFLSCFRAFFCWSRNSVLRLKLVLGFMVLISIPLSLAHGVILRCLWLKSEYCELIEEYVRGGRDTTHLVQAFALLPNRIEGQILLSKILFQAGVPSAPYTAVFIKAHLLDLQQSVVDADAWFRGFSFDKRTYGSSSLLWYASMLPMADSMFPDSTDCLVRSINLLDSSLLGAPIEEKLHIQLKSLLLRTEHMEVKNSAEYVNLIGELDRIIQANLTRLDRTHLFQEALDTLGQADAKAIATNADGAKKAKMAADRFLLLLQSRGRTVPGPREQPWLTSPARLWIYHVVAHHLWNQRSWFSKYEGNRAIVPNLMDSEAPKSQLESELELQLLAVIRLSNSPLNVFSTESGWLKGTFSSGEWKEDKILESLSQGWRF